VDQLRAFDQGYAVGVRNGYTEAQVRVSKYMKDIPASDPRYAVLADLSHFLKEEQERAVEACIAT
jgi:hypothetical protein